jgi:hypothetical protein
MQYLSASTDSVWMSQLSQGRLWPAGGCHSRSTPSFGIPRAFRHLRFVPILLQKSVEACREP